MIILIITLGCVFACSPAPPDPWFALDLEFDKDSIPEGILIVETHPDYEPYAIKNLNSEPFYLITEEQGLQINQK